MYMPKSYIHTHAGRQHTTSLIKKSTRTKKNCFIHMLHVVFFLLDIYVCNIRRITQQKHNEKHIKHTTYIEYKASVFREQSYISNNNYYYFIY